MAAAKTTARKGCDYPPPQGTQKCRTRCRAYPVHVQQYHCDHHRHPGQCTLLGELR